jgi:hypothetical protein
VPEAVSAVRRPTAGGSDAGAEFLVLLLAAAIALLGDILDDIAKAATFSGTGSGRILANELA